MVIQEQIKLGDKTFIKSYSDKYLFIERDGDKYSSAMDLPEFNYQYTETAERIFTDEQLQYLPAEIRDKVLTAYNL